MQFHGRKCDASADVVCIRRLKEPQKCHVNCQLFSILYAATKLSKQMLRGQSMMVLRGVELAIEEEMMCRQDPALQACYRLRWASAWTSPSNVAPGANVPSPDSRSALLTLMWDTSGIAAFQPFQPTKYVSSAPVAFLLLQDKVRHSAQDVQTSTSFRPREF